MFSKKDKAEITPGVPQFSVRYAGSTETYTATGAGCTALPVQRMWDNSPDEKRMRKYLMLINPSGIFLQDADKSTDEDAIYMRFDIRDISYVSAELDQHERVFSWVSRDPATRRLFCHAVVCSSREKARGVAVVISRAFQVAYRDWKCDRQRQERQRQRSLSSHHPQATSPGFNKDGGSQIPKGSEIQDVNGNQSETNVWNIKPVE